MKNKIICKFCQKEFYRYPSRKAVFCSPRCQAKGRIGVKRLDVSERLKGNKYTLGYKHTEESKRKISEASKRPSSMKSKQLSDERRKKISDGMMGHKISQKTRQKISEAIKGEKNGSWKGGITPYYFKERNTPLLREWKKTILRLCDFTCQKCGQLGGKLEVHHINNFADFPELRTSIENGIIFCQNCHNEFHKEYGKRNNTVEQLEEFLT